jgi:hypothetical protein
MSEAMERAKRLARHYLVNLPGLTDPDCSAEVDDLVEALTDAAMDKIMDHLKKKGVISD